MSPREAWIDRAALQAITRWSPSTIKRKSRSGELKWRQSDKRGANGKPKREYLWLAQGGSEATITEQSQGPLAPFEAPLQGDLAAHRVIVPEKAMPQAQRRYGAIRPLIDFRSAPKRDRRRLLEKHGVANLSALVDRIAEAKGNSPASLWGWLRRFQKGGFAALADAPRKDKGQSRFFNKHPQARVLLEAKYFEERLSVQLSWQALHREWARVRSSDDDPPSYETVRQYLTKQPLILRTLAREGEKAFNDRCAPYVIRGPVPVMHTWVSDHAKHDVWVQNDSWIGRTGEAVRPWLTAIMDMGSRKIVGWAWCLEPSSNSISSVLRIGLLQFGAPHEAYIDNGKDFEKIGRLGDSPETKGVLQRLGVTPRFCIPRHPQSKPIERFFSTVRKRFDMLWRPYYCGASPDSRPDDCSEILKKHELFLKGKLRESPLPMASEFVRLARAWIEEYNAELPHKGRGMKGRTPDQVFDSAYPPERRKPVDRRVLDALLWDRSRRRVIRGGCIQINNARYEPEGAAFAQMMLRVGENVLVACDPYNLGEAIVLDDEGRYLGTVRAQALLQQGPTSHEHIRESMRLRRQARRGVKDYIAGLASLRQAAGLPTELQALKQRAALRATGTDDTPGAIVPHQLRAAPAPAAERKPYVWISDAVEEDSHLFDNLLGEADGPAPGVQSEKPEAPPSPFIDDAVRKVIEAMKEGEAEGSD